jgi:hypothetical protein
VQELWHSICSAVLTEVYRNNLPVWFTEIGYVSLQDGLLASDQTSVQRKRMLSEAKLAIIFVSEDLLAITCVLADDRVLRPRTLCRRLQHTTSTENMSKESRLMLLEFLLTELSLSDIAVLERFPFQDGKFRSLDITAAFLNRDEFETELFVRQQDRTIDSCQLTEKGVRHFHEQVKQDGLILRYRTTEDLRDYCLQFVVKEMSDTVVLTDGAKKLLNDIWTWIFKYGEDELNLSALGSLQLVPLQGGGLGRLVPINDSELVTWFRAGRMRDLSLKIVALDPRNSPNMLAENVLSRGQFCQLICR